MGQDEGKKKRNISVATWLNIVVYVMLGFILIPGIPDYIQHAHWLHNCKELRYPKDWPMPELTAPADAIGFASYYGLLGEMPCSVELAMDGKRRYGSEPFAVAFQSGMAWDELAEQVETYVIAEGYVESSRREDYRFKGISWVKAEGKPLDDIDYSQQWSVHLTQLEGSFARDKYRLLIGKPERND